MQNFVFDNVGEVIAERRLYLEGQPATRIRVLLGRPQRRPSPSNDEFSLCPYQIVGIGDEKVKTAGGVDAFQALQLAFEMIGSDLYFSLNRRYGGKLRWESGNKGDLGFPVPDGLESETQIL